METITKRFEEYVLPGVERLFGIGQQFIVSPAQAEVIRNIRHAERKYEISELSCVARLKGGDSVSFKAKKVQVLPASLTVQPMEMNWSSRVVKVFGLAEQNHLMLVTSGTDTKPTWVKGIRSALIRAGTNCDTYAQIQVTIYDQVEDAIFLGALIGFNLTPDPKEAAEPKEVADA